MRHLRYLLLTILVFNTLLLQASDVKVQLTKEEKDWLKKNPEIKLTMPAYQEPVFFVKNGKAQGIIPDIANEIFKNIGHKISLVPIEKNFSVLLDLDKSGIYGSATVVDKESYKESLVFTQPYYETLLNIFVHKDNANNIISKKNLSGKRVAIMKNHKITIIYFYKVIKSLLYPK